MKTAWIVAGLCASAFASASIVVPNNLAAAEGDGVFSLTATATGGRTYQMTIAASQLVGAVGSNITGVQFRMNGAAATWPSVNTSYTQWDMFLGPGVAPSAMSNTFTANFASSPTQVRSGGLTFLANAFTGGAGPNASGQAINFNNAYPHTGGNLTLEMRYSPQSGATNQPAFPAAAASGGPANGWGVDFAGPWTASSVGTAGGTANFLVTNVITAPVPEPASLAALSLGALALLRRRRTRKN